MTPDMRLILTAILVALGLLLPRDALANPRLSPEEVATFLDAYIPAQMQVHGIPGVAVSAVLGDRVLFARGYGVADVVTGRAMDPDDTILTTASLSKAVTAMAVLQLADRGVIGLDDDVRPYLDDPALVANIRHGVTFRQLLTHTDGFEARLLGSVTLSEAELRPLAETLLTHPPRQVQMPGQFLTYGNYAANLAGHLVAEISGQGFEAYVAENIFTPLGMDETSFDQRLAPEVRVRLATGYDRGRDGLTPVPHVLVNNAPEGGMRGPLRDQTRLMQALLSEGALHGARVLSPASTASMLTPAFSSDARLPGISLGLFEHWTAGQTTFIRDGDGLGVRTRMVLFPARSFGLFISYNLGDSALRLEIADALATALFGAEADAPDPQPLERSDLAGSYRALQADTTSFTKSMFLFSQTILVTQPEDHMIELTTGGLLGAGQSNPFGGFEGTTRWVETAPLLFKSEQGAGLIAFQSNSRGEIVRLVSGQGYHAPFMRLPWHESLPVQMLLLELCAGLLLVFVAASALGLPGRTLWLRLTKHPTPTMFWPAGAANLFVTIAAALFLLLYLRTIGALYAGGEIAGLPNFVFGVSDEMRQVLNDMRLAPVLGVPVAGVIVLAWLRGFWSTGWRVFASLAALAYGGLLLSAHTWNLIGFQV